MTQQTLANWRERLTNQKATYKFEEGNAKMRDLLGGKGANLAEMTRLGFPVPPGFTVTTEVCNLYLESGKKLPPGLEEEIKQHVHTLEQKMGKGFGDPKNPLLVSVRSGARFSMPGMMDTVLNLGLNEETVNGLAAQANDERFALDAYRRFIGMFSDVVLGLHKAEFEHILREHKDKQGVKEDRELTPQSLRSVIQAYKAKVQHSLNRPFPEDVWEQLKLAVEAVFRSWDNPRANVYREREKIPHNLGTAVNVQCMCFGNMGEDSGTGVAFTRDYNTGAKHMVGDFLTNAQGEDVVAGIRTPMPLDHMKQTMPESYKQLEETAMKLEEHFKDLQDMEFTIEKGRLFMLQTRNGKRTAQAAVRIAVDMVAEGKITREEAVLRVSGEQLDKLLHPFIPEQARAQATAEGRLLARGTGASPGAACGHVVFDSDEAAAVGKEGKPVILVRPETTPDDAHGMLASKGILTSTGGPSSHAALVARGWGIPCVVGCEALKIDLKAETVTVADRTFGKMELITIDGTSGEVLLGRLPLEEPTDLSPETRTILEWADGYRKLGVYANADNPRDAQRARGFGASGIGLCRTEHMFMEKERLPVAQQMILAAPEAERLQRAVHQLEMDFEGAAEGRRKEEARKNLEAARARLMGPWAHYTQLLDQLLPMQREDFKGILKAMEGCWVIIRLLDPPLHEFLPAKDELLVQVTRLRTLKDVGPEAFQKGLAEVRQEREDEGLTLESLSALLSRVESMDEFNPMLGCRVCRLGIVYPEIYKMQIRAIFEAACDLVKAGVDARPEVMIPGVGTLAEMEFTRSMVEAVAAEVQSRMGVQVKHKIGTMVELPRAALCAGSLATKADFFSFGTNDLTQTTFGYSRDDAAGTFMPVYLDKKILKVDPFQVVDREGVGRLMRLAVEEGRQTNSELEVGICGEHGGDPESVEFCHTLNLNYVSCSPFRVPIARLSAAHAALKEKLGEVSSTK
ncbi:MAG: pyruvate, phosphate dikinase [Candidatus Eremiobacterota bacterium]